MTLKESSEPPAGIFTQPYLMSYLANTFSSIGCMDYLIDFTSKNGAEFLQLPPKEMEYIHIEEKRLKVVKNCFHIAYRFQRKLMEYARLWQAKS